MTEIFNQAKARQLAEGPQYDHHPLGPWQNAMWDALPQDY